MTRDDLRPAAISRDDAIRALAEAWPNTGIGIPIAVINSLDALTPSAKSTLARYLLGDAIDGLDVERLTDALLATQPKGPRVLVRQDATAIAAEYARLAEPKP